MLRGEAAVIRKGKETIRGNILTWLNADDYYFPEPLAAVRYYPGTKTLSSDGLRCREIWPIESKYVQEDLFPHRRKCIVGDWKSYFGDRLKEAFKAKYARYLIETGYEKNDFSQMDPIFQYSKLSVVFFSGCK